LHSTYIIHNHNPRYECPFLNHESGQEICIFFLVDVSGFIYNWFDYREKGLRPSDGTREALPAQKRVPWFFFNRIESKPGERT
jgi:hypothetical protein